MMRAFPMPSMCALGHTISSEEGCHNQLTHYPGPNRVDLGQPTESQRKVKPLREAQYD
jgi:hypothetical protein